MTLLALSAWRLWKLGRVPRGVIVTGTIALAFFGLAALGQSDLRPPTSSRYQLPGALFLLLFFVEILRGLRLGAPVLAAAATVVLVTSLSGIDLMREQARERWVPSSTWTSTYLGTVAYAGDAASPDLILELGSGSEVPVRRFLEEVDASGSPGLSPEELISRDAGLRGQADRFLVDLTGLGLTGERPVTGPGRCGRHRAGSAVTLGHPGDVVKIRSIDPSRDLELGLSRFGEPPGVPIGAVIAGSRAWLALPEIDLPPDWKLTGDGPFAICQR